MSLLDDVSIVVTPNGYKASKLYAVIPSNGDADMDVTRATAATRVDESGLIADVLSNVPRIDYTGGGCPHILAEPQRTNLLTYSEDFSQWAKNSGTTITTNNAISPDGTQNASLIVASGTGSRTGLDVSIVSGTTYTLSVYLKNNGGNTSISMGSHTTTQLETITINNEWNRYTTTFVASSTTTSSIRIISSGSNINLYAWGAQLEEGSYETSYIPTEGTTATRAIEKYESAEDISGLIGQTEGTFFIELSKPVLEPDNYYLISLNNAASNSDVNSVTIGFNNVSDDFYIRLRANASNIFTDNTTASLANTFYKIAIAYKSGQSLIYIDGSPITPNGGNLSNAFAFTATLDNLSFDYNGNGVLPFYGNVRQLQVYKTALTDEQLTSLTS